MSEPSKAALEAALEIRAEIRASPNEMPQLAAIIDRAMEPERNAAEELAKAFAPFEDLCLLRYERIMDAEIASDVTTVKIAFFRPGIISTDRGDYLAYWNAMLAALAAYRAARS